jgi:hypothetical protein
VTRLLIRERPIHFARAAVLAASIAAVTVLGACQPLGRLVHIAASQTPTPSPTLTDSLSPAPTALPTLTLTLEALLPSITATEIRLLPSPTRGGCQDGMDLVLRLDETGGIVNETPLVDPGSAFRAGWRVRNSGNCTWDSSYTLVYAGEGQPEYALSGRPVMISGRVLPGQMYDFYVELVAPFEAGQYQDTWELRNGRNAAVGEQLEIGVEVPFTAQATEQPGDEIYFVARPEWLDKGGKAALITWDVRQARQVYFYEYGQAWNEHPVQPTGNTYVFPYATTSYYLRVVKWDQSVETRKVVVHVEPLVPVIVSFQLKPRAELEFGDCVQMTWEVRGSQSTVISLLRGETVLWVGAPLVGTMGDCPRTMGEIVYTLYAVSAWGESSAERTIDVVP